MSKKFVLFVYVPIAILLISYIFIVNPELQKSKCRVSYNNFRDVMVAENRVFEPEIVRAVLDMCDHGVWVGSKKNE